MAKQELIEFTQEEEAMIQREFEALLDDYSHTLHRQKVELITRAFKFANQAHNGVRRLSGEPYILHPLAVARICVREIGLGSTSICCALLHDVVEDTEYTVEDMRNLFGDKIAQIVDGLTKISGGVFGDKASEQAENFRKLLLTMSDDIRVVLIKIADRLHNMRTLGAQPKEKQYKIAGETLYIYAPLAHRLGLFSIKSELEDLSFHYEHPDTYAEIEAKIEAVKGQHLETFERFADPIRTKLTNMGYEFTLTARIKSIYSIWKKMTTKNIPFEDIYDLMAVRIVFTPQDSLSEKDQCWMIYSAITEIYRPHPERIRDWISTPKSNGYEALHVTVMAPDGEWIEVQIRTRRMNEIAERGLAAHWKYKVGESDESELDKWLREIKEILANPEPNAMDFLGTFKLNLFQQEVFVFTPQGEIITLPQGATALDLAFHLHSELGEHCMGAKVNHNLEPLSYVLQSGDQVEIMTNPNQHPQQDWLDFVVTARAQSRLKAFFRKEDRNIIKLGESLFMDALERHKGTEMREQALAKIMAYYQLQHPTQLYLQLGQGLISLDHFEEIVHPKKSLWTRLNPFASNGAPKLPTQFKEEDAVKPVLKYPKGHQFVLTDENIGTTYHLCSRCHPIPGDDVLGYVRDDGRIDIHTLECPEAELLKTSQGKRIYSATWNTHHLQSFMETIEIRGIDKLGVLANIITVITGQFHINMSDVHIHCDDGIFVANIRIFVFEQKEVMNLFKVLKKIPEIQSVQRIKNR